MISLALFEPEIPQNTGSLIRLCACFDVVLHIIEPCGFLWDSKKLDRSVMDYQSFCLVMRHLSFMNFKKYVNEHQKRIVLIDVKGEHNFWHFKYQQNDVLLMGKESIGVPQEIKSDCHSSLYIPQKQGRSLNLAIAASIVLTEGMRHLNACAISF